MYSIRILIFTIQRPWDISPFCTFNEVYWKWKSWGNWFGWKVITRTRNSDKLGSHVLLHSLCWHVVCCYVVVWLVCCSICQMPTIVFVGRPTVCQLTTCVLRMPSCSTDSIVIHWSLIRRDKPRSSSSMSTGIRKSQKPGLQQRCCFKLFTATDTAIVAMTQLTFPYLRGGQVVAPAQRWDRISSAQCATPM